MKHEPRKRSPSPWVFRALLPVLYLLLGAGAGLAADPKPAAPVSSWRTSSEGSGLRLDGSRDHAPLFGYRVVNVYPHDPEAFTQGLIHLEGFLYESTGLRGRSTLRRVKLETGEVLQSHSLAPIHFGEGLTHWGDHLVQLTWRSRVGFVYDRATFKNLRQFPLQGEGWGLTQDASSLIVSDGSDRLQFLDPLNFSPVRTLPVRDRGMPIHRLNELEFVKGEILANIWQEDVVARISPLTGEVHGWVDLSGLRKLLGEGGDRAQCLNGIAHDAHKDRLFVTGKFWPRLFEIELQPLPAASARPGP